MYIGDLHIHSRYSRATSRDCTPEQLDIWARRKGIDIVGTGDFTHPAWREELKDKLEPGEDGLYYLKKELAVEDGTGAGSRRPRFVVSGEISSIYKKNGKVRKVHSLILLPGLEEAERLEARLETIGNIHSDGRPILGLDCRDLLEITLDICPNAIYIPAHIWTPHFSLFGAFSGFDSVEECYEDMAPYVHAMETGLSSDPPMNWRLSALDSYQLVSNSDAHSPAKLGREANLFQMEMCYDNLEKAIQTGEGLEGTIEFFPEEGKYHFDGHRKCHICLSPVEAERLGGKCPVCGKKLTVGVDHRVEQLADREEGYVKPGAKPFESLVPLAEVIGASTGKSAASVKVQEQYWKLMRKLGNEFSVLREIPIEDIKKASGYLVAEGIKRLRQGDVKRNPGFDGEYGTVNLFEPDEIQNPDGQMSLFFDSSLTAVLEKTEISEEKSEEKEYEPGTAAQGEILFKMQNNLPGNNLPGNNLPGNNLPGSVVLNSEQEMAVKSAGSDTVVVAGPGTGKTGTLTARISYMMEARKVKASQITAVTFTNQAARELRERLEKRLGARKCRLMRISTFHGICFDLLKKSEREFQLADEIMAADIGAQIIEELDLKVRPRQLLQQISEIKTKILPNLCEDQKLIEEIDEKWAKAFELYEEKLKEANALDFDDLQTEALILAQKDSSKALWRKGFDYLLVDEFQDVSPIQYQLIKEWRKHGRELFAIGDPDQSIYSFRGGEAKCFQKLEEDFPHVCRISLEENYRSAPQILNNALSVISKNPGEERKLKATAKDGKKVKVVTAGLPMSEAIYAAKEIGRLVGGIDMLEAQTGSEKGEEAGSRSFSDIAVLYRTRKQAKLLEKCLSQEGIPYVVAGRDEFLTDKSIRRTAAFFLSIMEENQIAKDGAEKWLGQEEWEKLAEKYKPLIKKKAPGEILQKWAADIQEDEEALKKFVSMSLCYKNMAEFFQELEFGQEFDLKRWGGKKYTSDAVTLTTLHGSKGLEYPVVIINGARKGLLPLETKGRVENPEEERRLFYVGMTRAKEELIITSSKEQSEYLKDLQEQDTVYVTEEKSREQKKIKQISLFDFLD